MRLSFRKWSTKRKPHLKNILDGYRCTQFVNKIIISFFDLLYEAVEKNSVVSKNDLSLHSSIREETYCFTEDGYSSLLILNLDYGLLS
jgi:hypothetical protein